MNPAVLDAFALAIIAYGEPHSYTILAGHRPDVTAAQKMPSQSRILHVSYGKSHQMQVRTCPKVIFDREWQQSFYGPHYPRLRAVKKKYDPEGLFFVHHGVGSEEWSPDGFTRLQNST